MGLSQKIYNSGTRKWRLVIHYRKFDEFTTTDIFPIPLREGVLDKLGKAQYFTTLDLAKGFHQILIKDEDGFFDTIQFKKCAFCFSETYELNPERIYKQNLHHLLN